MKHLIAIVALLVTQTVHAIPEPELAVVLRDINQPGYLLVCSIPADYLQADKTWIRQANCFRIPEAIWFEKSLTCPAYEPPVYLDCSED
jgi:hypothetical protein